VHTDDPMHLWGNLFEYLLVSCCIFRFTVRKTERRIAYALILLAAPFIISYASIVAFASIEINTLGFSGVVAAFIGYFVYVFYEYIKTRYIPTLNFSFPMIVLSTNLVIVILRYYLSLVLWSVPLILMLALWFIMWRKEILSGGKQAKEKYKKMPLGKKMENLSAYFFAFYFLFFAFPPMLAPPAEGAVVNVIAHFAGYLFGFFVPLLIFDSLPIVGKLRK